MYKPIDKREKFNESMDAELLANGFAYYSDWEYGPESGWECQDHYVLSLMRHDYGYWLIISHHASGENPKMNIGSSNDAKEIIAVRDALKVLW
jgi:hypothetical protein